MTRVLITGSRHWTDEKSIKRAMNVIQLKHHGPHTLVSGAGDGADHIAEQYAERLGWTVERHPANWALGPRAGPMRNRDMVKLGADLCLAAPLPDSKGTIDCMTRVEAAGIPIVLITMKAQT